LSVKEIRPKYEEDRLLIRDSGSVTRKSESSWSDSAC